MRPSVDSLRRFVWYGLGAILVGLPFHAFVMTWLGTIIDPPAITVLRYWKEVLLLLMGTAIVGILAQDQASRRTLRHDRLAWAVAILALLHVGTIIAFGGSVAAIILGLKINLGFLILYLIVATAAPQVRLRHVAYLILIPAAIVGGIGTLQLTVLPPDILTHFGYGALGQPNPAFYLIEASNTLRIMSTLWGPNQLGSYLILPLILAVWCAYSQRGKLALAASAIAILDLIALYGSHSRGAWLAAATGLYVLGIVVSHGWKRYVVIIAPLVAGAALAAFATSSQAPDKLKLIIFHGIPASVDTGYISSNQGHVLALQAGVKQLSQYPFGAGLEAAGRASEGLAGQLYTESFYLQLAVQTGYQGLLAFIAVMFITLWRCLKDHFHHPLAPVLIASFIGLSINNLVAHTWSDGATAWIWWGVAGLIYAQRRRT